MKQEDLERHRRNYEELLHLYDMAEKLLESVEHDSVSDPNLHLDIIEPVIEQIEEAANYLTEEYCNFVLTGQSPDVYNKKKIELCLKHLNMAIENCRSKLISNI